MMKFHFPETDHAFVVRGTEIRPDDTQEQYLQKLARIALDEMHQRVSVLTPEGILLECNGAALEHSGFTHGEVVGKAFWESFPETISAKVQHDLRQAIARTARGEHVRHQVEVYAGRQNKKAVLIDFTLRPIRDEAGRIVLLLAEGREITTTNGERDEQLDKGASPLATESEIERNLLRDLLTNAPAAIALLSGPHHRFTYVNDLYVRMTGRSSADDFLGKNIREALPELEGQGFMELLDEVYKTGKPFTGSEMKIKLNRAPHGKPEDAYFTFIYQPMHTASGDVAGITVHAQEVTSQVKARRSVEMSEERLRLAQAAAQIGTWEWDPVTGIGTLSAELHHMFGTEPNDPEHVQKWYSRVDPADLLRVRQAMEYSQHTNIIELEYRYRHPQLGLRWFYTKGRRIPGENNMFGILLDVTERKQIDETRHRLAAIVESSDDAIISKDLNGIVTSWNKAAERLFGYRAEEMVGRPILTIIPPELHSDEAMILGKLRRAERIDHFETVRVKKDGERLNVSLTISPVKDASGNVVGAAKIARDITEHRKIEQALRTTEKLAAAGRMAATVAHEINNPLEAVTNLVYLAKRDLREGNRASTHLDQASRELERVAHIARQTLGFYRETSAPTFVNLPQMFDELLPLYDKRLQVRKIKIVRQYEDDIAVSALAGELRQAFSNLISNSIDAMPSGGSLVVRISRSRNWRNRQIRGARITILDTGSGIAPQHRKHLFQPFFTTKSDVGTGLGLWITRNIVAKHGGAIHVRSSVENEQHGTAFSIFLPYTQEEEDRQDQARLAVARSIVA